MTYIRKAHQAENHITNKDIAIFPLMGLVSVGGVLALLLPMFIFDFGKILPKNLIEVGLIIAYGAIGQCLAWGLIAYSIPRLSLALTGLLLLSEPVVALLIDYFYLNKKYRERAMAWGVFNYVCDLFGVGKCQKIALNIAINF